MKAFDLTFSAPKAVSLLWLGSEPVAGSVMTAHREAVETALGFLDEHAAVARMQVDAIRRHVATHGWVVAGFVHRTSRDGDPQLHTHCLVPNVVRRGPDGRCTATTGSPFHHRRAAVLLPPLFRWQRHRGGVDEGATVATSVWA